MKKAYHRPELVEYGSMAELTLGGGSSSLDLNISWNPQNIDNPVGIGTSPGSGCVIVNGQPCNCS